MAKTLKIALSGAQGTGKTTLMTALKNSQVVVDEGDIEFLPEIVRDLKAKYDIKINELGTLETEMMVMTTHLQNVIARKKFVSDRCLVDNMIYAMLSNNPPPKEYMDFDWWLVDRMVDSYDIIFYLPVEFMPPNDGVRNLEPEYYNKVRDKFEEVYAILGERHPNKIVRVHGSIPERIDQIEDKIQEILWAKWTEEEMKKANKRS